MLMNFKLCLILVIFFAPYNSLQFKMNDMPPEFQEACAKVHALCLEETGANDANVRTFNDGNFIGQDRSSKCFLKCVWSHFGIIDDAGIVDTEKLKSSVPPFFSAAVGPTIDKCGTQKGQDACDNAFLTNKCYYDNMAENFFVL